MLSIAMKLLGSTTSPFARRLRIFLADEAYEFINLDIFAEKDRDLLTKNNPAQKIPTLIDGEQCIYDSRVIYRYLASKYQQTALTWSQENLLTLIDAANDSLVSMLVLQRSEIDTDKDSLFFNLQRERVEQVFSALDKEVRQGSFNDWNYLTICLFCLLDWAEFRNLAQWQHFSELKVLHQKYSSRAEVKRTDPR